MATMIVKFQQWTCIVEPMFYSNGRLALKLVDIDTGELVEKGTVNLPDASLPDGHIFVNEYGDRKGMIRALKTAGIIGDPVCYVRSGFVMIPMCPLLIDIDEN